MTLAYPLSFQLYSARAFQPLAQQLKTLAEVGFRNVEPYDDLYGDLAGLKSALDENGLSAASGHFDLAMVESDPQKAIGIARTLGMTVVVCPWLDEADRPVDAAGWQALGARLSALNAIFAEAGITFAWHNHDFEFVALPDGSIPIEHIFESNTVSFEMDVAWIVRAGVDPLPWITRYADRLVAVHVKDLAAEGENLDQDGWAHLGQGVVDWSTLWPAIAATSVRVAVLEHDEPKDYRLFAEESAAEFARLAAATN